MGSLSLSLSLRFLTPFSIHTSFFLSIVSPRPLPLFSLLIPCLSVFLSVCLSRCCTPDIGSRCRKGSRSVCPMRVDFCGDYLSVLFYKKNKKYLCCSYKTAFSVLYQFIKEEIKIRVRVKRTSPFHKLEVVIKC